MVCVYIDDYSLKFSVPAGCYEQAEFIRRIIEEGIKSNVLIEDVEGYKEGSLYVDNKRLSTLHPINIETNEEEFHFRCCGPVFVGYPPLPSERFFETDTFNRLEIKVKQSKILGSPLSETECVDYLCGSLEEEDTVEYAKTLLDGAILPEDMDKVVRLALLKAQEFS